MIRKTFLILLAVILVCGIADWKRFRDRARPALQPLIEWIEPDREPTLTETVAPQRPEGEPRPPSVDALLEEARQLSDAQQPNNFPDLHEKIRSWATEDLDARGQRVETIDTALASVHHELQQVEREIHRIERESAAGYEQLNREHLPREDHQARVLELEADYRRRIAAQEARRRLLEHELARIQSMKQRLVQR